MTEAETIANKLTKAQRRAVLTRDDGFAIGHKGKWAFMSSPTARILHNLGLIEAPRSMCFPTPLGLEVRRILKEQENG